MRSSFVGASFVSRTILQGDHQLSYPEQTCRSPAGVSMSRGGVKVAVTSRKVASRV